jgi:pantoate--beta-alanine ligase
MQTINDPKTLHDAIHSLKKRDGKVALVPTMGYIHKGHLEVIKVARENSDYVVVSIFVNPTQFDDKTDFEKYPRDIERDEELLKSAGVNILYLPKKEDIYPEGVGNTTTVLLNKNLTQNLCGATRTGHFEGVLLVVSKLVNRIQPDVVVFGEKDYQQYIILKRMVDELLYPTDVLACPIIREESGLAMSSRNTKLSEKGRKDAAFLYKSLLLFHDEYKKIRNDGKIESEEKLKKLEGQLVDLERKLKSFITEKIPCRIDYVQILDAEILHTITSKKIPILFP